MEFLIDNRAFLPPYINDKRFNPDPHYCPRLEWAYEIRMQKKQASLLVMDLAVRKTFKESTYMRFLPQKI